MKKSVALFVLIGCALFAFGARTQEVNDPSHKLLALEQRYLELSSKYGEKCKLALGKTDLALNRIEQGAGLEGGMEFPVTIQIVSVLREIQTDLADDMCDKAKDYLNFAEVVAEVERGQSVRP